MKQKKVTVSGKQQRRRWAESEDETIFRYVRARPQNLKRCFLLVSEQIGRTPGAVENRWYTHVSKTPHAVAFFTASPQHVSANRKNGEGVATDNSIWRKLLAAIKGIV